MQWGGLMPVDRDRAMWRGSDLTQQFPWEAYRAGGKAHRLPRSRR
ncbi:MAG: hypothetical protein ACI9SE_004621, partial [Neolewinella sp.]